MNCDKSRQIARQFCPGFSDTGPFPARCATFNQLGVRVPLLAVSPFAKPHYVSHQVSDHTSLLALIERRFLGSQSLTARDASADTLEDLFVFAHSPSLHARVHPSLAVPARSADPGCSPA